jgi:hypothetical protein
MKETLYPQTLARAAEAEGGTAALARRPCADALTAEFVCRACGHKVKHGDLVARLAHDAVQHAHTMTAARKRRYGVLTPSSRKKPAVSG